MNEFNAKYFINQCKKINRCLYFVPYNFLFAVLNYVKCIFFYPKNF